MSRKNNHAKTANGGGGIVGRGTDDPHGLKHITALLADVLATLYEIAAEPERLGEHTKSDLLLAIAREVNALGQNCKLTVAYLENLALVALSDEMGRK